MNIRKIVQESDTPAGRGFDLFVLFLVVYSIVTLTVETVPGLPPVAEQALRISEVAITLAFTIEYVLRVATAPRKRDYIFSFYGVIDLIAVLPFYLSLGFDLRAVRAFRLFRIFRIFKVTRYSVALERFGKALSYAREETLIFSLATLIVLYLSAVGIYHFENEAQPEAFSSIFHSLWWAVTTLTTVGYGDVYPVTAGGKAFTFAVLMCGLGIVAVPAGLVSSALSKVRQEEDR